MGTMMRASRPAPPRCIVHPDSGGYRDPANRMIWRCIACEEGGIADRLLNWRDYHSGSAPTEIKRSVGKRIAMRATYYKRKIAKAGA